MKPRVILHNALSADGRIDWFPADIGLFYELAATWHEDATLAGSGTILSSGGGVEAPEGTTAADGAAASDGAAAAGDAARGQSVRPEGSPNAQPSGEPDRRPVLAVVDSRGQVRGWGTLLASGYWRAGVSLCSATTPPEHLAWLEGHGLQRIVTGADRVDLAAALGELAERFGVKTVRVDSGGKLNGELLRLGLVDEISLLVHPYLVGGTSAASMYRAADLVHEVGVLQLELLQSRKVKQGIVWLRYAVRK
jgi:2,5-diamino-6-(ribosylamino)-4(3H)-pyrimidinone 5'-phosphate reductase